MMIGVLAAVAVLASADVLRIDEPVTVDGRLDEPFWAKAPEHTGFRPLAQRATGPVKAQTGFRVAADAHNVYFAVTAYEPQMAKLKATRDQAALLWFHDDIQLFISPDANPQEYYQFVCFYRRGLGKYAQFFAESGHICPDPYAPEWRCALAEGDDRYTVEFAIPLSAFYMTRNGAWKETWHVNITRNNKMEDGYTTWCPLEGGFHEPKSFRPLSGFPRRLAEDDLAVRSAEPVLTGVEDGRFVGTLKLDVFAALGGKVRIAAGEAAPAEVTLPEGQGIVSVPCSFPGNGRHHTGIRLERLDGPGKGRVAWRSYPVAVDFDLLQTRFTLPEYRDNFYPGQDASIVRGSVRSVMKDAVTLTLEGPGIPRTVKTLPAGGGDFSFATPGFAEGTATLTVAAGGETRQRKVRRLAPSGRRMAWVSKGRLVVDGRPILRRSMYQECFHYLTGKAYDALWAAERDNFGMDFIYGVVDLSAGRLFDGDIESEEVVKDKVPAQKVFDKMAAVIEKNRGRDFTHYYLADEPECRGLSEIYLKHCYEFIKERDPYHPVLISSRGGAKYIGCCDWMEAHPYLSAYTDRTGARAYMTPPETFGSLISPVADLGRGDKVIGCIPTVFSYLFCNNYADYPTLDELVLTVWACAGRGARSFAGYLHADLRDRPSIWRGVPYVYSSLETLSDYLLDGARRSVVRTTQVEADEFTLPVGKLLVLLNFTSEPQTVDLKDVSGTFHEFRGTRTFDLQANRRTVSLKPLETIVATTDVRKDGRASLAATRALVDYEEGIRRGRDNQLLDRYLDITFPKSCRQGTCYKLFDGTYEPVAWRTGNPSGDQTLEMEFRNGFRPTFDRMRLHGDVTDGVRVSVFADGAWRSVEARETRHVGGLRELKLEKRVTAEKLRLEFPAKGDLELYEVELPW